jgi:asparagine synthase (glutamine-hydrolysing)
MCGIAGFQGGFDTDLLAQMSALIAHRGPDDSGLFCAPEHGLGLAHRRLSIIDLSPSGHQPMADTDDRAVIIFNGEIYNFRALRDELTCDGVLFRGHSDTEVLLDLYLRDGLNMLARLNGIFAFAIWDTVKRELFIARDGLGVKPLYYAETDAGFIFASEMKAILQAAEINREIDPIALRHYLTYLWCPAPRTPLRQVKKLEPGCALTVCEGRVERYWRFYELPFRQPMVSLFECEAIDQTRRALRTAVQRQMVADVPVGAFLSGGLDSSAVVAFAREASPETRLQCFTIALDGRDALHEGMTADLPYAEAVARHLGVDLHTVRVGPEMADELSTMIYHLDEPQADPAPLNVLFIARLAREYGIKVLFSGAGGDDIFTGYHRHRALVLEHYWSWWPQSVRATLARAAYALPARSATLRRMGKAFQYADRDGDARLASYFYWLNPGMVEELLTPELRAVSQGEEPLVASLTDLPGDVAALNRMLYLECKHFLADHNLNYTDKMSMAAGVEVRVPLLDPDLIALTSQQPLHYKQRGAAGKWIFKKAMEGMLPREVIYRPKTGFGAPLRAWLHGPLKEMTGDILSGDSLRQRGWFDPAAVERLLEADRAGRVDAAYPLFAVLCVELWGRIFLDK